MNTLGWSAPKTVWKLFPLIISISFAMDVYVPAMPAMTEYFHTSGNMMQASLYLFMLTVAIAQLVIGPLADVWGRKSTACCTALLFLAGSMLCAFANSLALLLLGRIVQAMGACGTYLLCFIIVRDNFQTKTCARLFSLLGGINSIVASMAPVIGGVLLDITHSWRTGFYFLSALGALIVLAALHNIPRDATHAIIKSKKPSLMVWRIVFHNYYFKVYTVIASACLLGLYLFCALSPDILIKKLGLSGTHYGLWFGLNAAMVFFANLFAAYQTQYFPLESIVKNGLYVVVLAGGSMLGLNFFYTTVYSFMCPMLVMTFGIGMSMGSSIALALRDCEAYAGVATAMVSAAQFGCSALIGFFISCTVLNPFSLAIPVMLFMVLGLLFYPRQNVESGNQHGLGRDGF